MGCSGSTLEEPLAPANAEIQELLAKSRPASGHCPALQARDHNGQTPLHRAAMNPDVNLDLLRRLGEASGSTVLLTKDKNQFVPVQLAASLAVAEDEGAAGEKRCDMAVDILMNALWASLSHQSENYKNMQSKFQGKAPAGMLLPTLLLRDAQAAEKLDGELRNSQSSSARHTVDTILAPVLEWLAPALEFEFSKRKKDEYLSEHSQVDLGKSDSSWAGLKLLGLDRLGHITFKELLFYAFSKHPRNVQEALLGAVNAHSRKSVEEAAASASASERKGILRYGVFAAANIIAVLSDLAGDTTGAADSQELQAMLSAYKLEFQMPASWDFNDALVHIRSVVELSKPKPSPPPCSKNWQGPLPWGDELNCIGLAGGDLVIRQEITAESPEFSWVQKLITNTFLKKSTQDRKDCLGELPDFLELVRLFQVMNCANWREYFEQRDHVAMSCQTTAGGLPGFESTLLITDPFPHPSEDWALKKNLNEAWVWHGTSGHGAKAITAKDFRLRHKKHQQALTRGQQTVTSSAVPPPPALSLPQTTQAPTEDDAFGGQGGLYGYGIYLAEASSKSDEYTEPLGRDHLRTLLLCRAVLGRMLYVDEEKPNVERLEESCTGDNPLFHSVLGDREKLRGTYKELVVYDDNQCYPAYICCYRRVYQGRESYLY